MSLTLSCISHFKIHVLLCLKKSTKQHLKLARAPILRELQKSNSQLLGSVSYCLQLHLFLVGSPHLFTTLYANIIKWLFCEQ